MVRTAFISCLITVMVPACGWSQLREKIDEDEIMLAEQYAMELVQRRANLPAKWAALQERDERHLTRVDELKVGVTRVEEFTAHKQNENVTLHHIAKRSRIDNALSTEPPVDWDSEPFGNNDKWLYRRPGLVLFKERGTKWAIVPKVPKSDCPPTDPFSWCVGAFSSASLGSLTESHLDYFFGETRVCVAAIETKKGLLTYWGSPGPRKLASGTRFLFDKVHHLPIEVQWDFYRDGWDPVKHADLPHSTQSKLMIGWSEFKSNESKRLLPVKIDLVQTFNGFTPHHVELTNRIRWLLNDDVPDSLFEDPSKREIVLPTFPDYPADQK